MKIIQTDGHTMLLRFDRGDEVVSFLEKIAEEHNIGAGYFQAIGACGELTISFYDLETQAYLDQTYTEDLEILSLLGNIAMFQHKPLVHAHGTFGRRDYSTIGGHVKRMVVSATCEMNLTTLSRPIERSHDADTGLNLIQE